jgi:transposase
MRAVLDAILYLLRTGCQWRQLPADFPLADGARLFPVLAHRRLLDRSAPCTLPPGPHRSRPEPWTDDRHMDGQSVKTSEKGAVAASMATSG